MASGLLAVLLFAAGSISLSAPSQVHPPLPGPAGYRLIDSSDSENETEEFATSPLDRVPVTGRRIVGWYEPLPLLKKRPLDLLTHYVTLAEARGGLRLFGYADSTGGQVSVRLPGPRPLWVSVRPADEGGGLEVVFVEEASNAARQLPVPAERITGQWSSTQPELSSFPESSRPALRTLFERITAAMRSASPLNPPMGALYLTTNSGGAFDVRLVARPRSQNCSTCPVDTGEGRLLVDVSFNQLEKAAPLSPLKGPGGEDWFEWHLATRESATTLRAVDGRRLFVRQDRPSPWTPVTQEAWLTAQIAALDDASRPPDLKKALAEQEDAIRAIEKTDPAAARAARDAMKEALASMASVKGGLAPEREALESRLKALSAEDRRKPTILPSGAALVSKNPAYFTASLPPEAVQLIVVTYANPQDYFLEVLVDRLTAVDWSWLVLTQGAKDR